ncbi:abortive infection family protein [Bacillus mobilis]|uniref:abortive infection family protein n=1 Tax=Bacillus mobilis TaxID=2026190 RepID=UPI00363CD405
MKNSLINLCQSDPLTYKRRLLSEFDCDAYLSDDDYQMARRIILKLREEYPLKYKVRYDFIKECRNIEEVISYFAFQTEDDMNYHNLSTISDFFNPYIDYIEELNIDIKIMHVNCDIPEELTYERLLNDLRTCEQRIDNGDYPGALTLARSLVEGVFKELIYSITGEEAGKEDLPKLYKKVREILNLNPSNPKLEKPLKDVLAGLIKIIDGLNEIRNANGDAHFAKYEVSLHHALLVVNSAETVVTFLFDTYEYQRETGKLKVIN